MQTSATRIRLRGVALGCVLCLLFGPAALSRRSGAPDEDLAPPTHRVHRATSEIVIDGTLDEPAWNAALVLHLDYEVRPGENTPPPVRTELRITFDDRRICFGFRAHDPEPERIRARLTDRDKAWDDDWVGVVLDTFNDERRAYELISNPLGVQIDALNDDVAQNYDTSWNAIWESAGRITADGYEVELAVPFNQIRFQASNGEPQTWGFDAMRSYPRGDRHHIGVFPRERGNNSYLSQTIKLVGMEGANPGRNLEFVPTLTSTRTDTRDDLPAGDLEQGDLDTDLGATLRWGITPNISLNGAVNPDFSQVEADVLRLDINEQFALFFPETRPFFLEGADYFNTPMDLVHTRTVADPSAAVKITGKQGRHTFGVFTALDETTDLIFPGEEESDAGGFDADATSTVARYRLDFRRNSTAGFTLTDRRGGGYANSVASLDTTFRLTEADRLTLNLARSRTRYSDTMVEEVGVRDDRFGDDALMVDYLHTVRDWWVNAWYEDFGEDFSSDMGHRPQVGYRSGFVGGAKIWWGEPGDFHRRAAWGGAATFSDFQSGEPMRRQVETWANMHGPRQSVVSVDVRLRDRWYLGTRFEDQWLYELFCEAQPGRNVQLNLEADWGDWIDFKHVRPADRIRVSPGLRVNVGRHLLLRYNHTYSELEVAGGQLFRAHAIEPRIVYQFSTRAYLRAIFQYVNIRRDPALYEDEVDERSEDLFAQLLFSYKVNPQTAVYVGYTDSYAGNETYDLTESSRTLFVKLGYAWVR